MSTRAIVGYKRTDGSVVGAWCWNDGYDIKNDLERDFKALVDINNLLGIAMFSTILSEEEYKEHVKWCKDNNISTRKKNIIWYGKSVILQDLHHAGREPFEYESVEDVLNQDINIAYIFENGKWKEYR